MSIIAIALLAFAPCRVTAGEKPPTTLRSEGQAKDFTFPAPVEGISLNPAGNRLAASCRDGFTYLLDLETGKRVKEFQQTLNQCERVKLAAGGKFLFCQSSTGLLPPQFEIQVWRVEDGKQLIPPLELKPGTISRVLMGRWATGDLSPDGRTAVVCGHGIDGLLVIDVESGNYVRKELPPELADAKRVAFSPDGRRLACEGERVVILSYPDLKVTGSYEPDHAGGWRFEQDNRLWRLQSEGQLRIVNVEDPAREHAYPIKDPDVSSWEVAPTGDLLAVALELSDKQPEPLVRVMGIDGATSLNLDVPWRAPWSLSFSSDATVLAARGDGATVRVWRLSKGDKARRGK